MLTFDHVVHYTKNASKAAEEMKEWGFHAIEGGHHPNWGTGNSLCYFDLSYIEFLEIQDDALAQQVTDNRLIQRVVEDAQIGEGLSQVALRTDNMRAAALDLKEKGLRIKDPIPGKRTRKDGSLIKWQLLFPETDDGQGPPLPFIIQWNESDDSRRADLKQQQAIRPHTTGKDLACVGFAVNNLEQRSAQWCEWFDLKYGDIYTDLSLKARCRLLPLPGRTNLLFCEPYDQGAALRTLETHGEHPFLVTMSGASWTKDSPLRGAIYRLQP